MGSGQQAKRKKPDRRPRTGRTGDTPPPDTFLGRAKVTRRRWAVICKSVWCEYRLYYDSPAARTSAMRNLRGRFIATFTTFEAGTAERVQVTVFKRKRIKKVKLYAIPQEQVPCVALFDDEFPGHQARSRLC